MAKYLQSKYFESVIMTKIDLDKSQRAMNKLTLGINGFWTTCTAHFDDAKAIINNPHLQWIKIENYQYQKNAKKKFGNINRLTQVIKSGDISLKSLKAIQACDVPHDHVFAQSSIYRINC